MKCPSLNYMEAVMTAEEDVGLTPALRKTVRNEYYWFSRQPRKQYNLWREFVRKATSTPTTPRA